ncbi:cell division protein FtsB [Hasllibacter halocynthiae]|uniref:Cell division protein FtsB n=1 Tax=Hasllibacter halocynthiae TaxID=595589 RepID=A0A2T0X8S5_9RHOB|nr:septum formation initiator family protein [Hasllibacter halocynthiae]PRY95346.1 cell division protein FtsB [Hasllibacter halocynthiae]
MAPHGGGPGLGWIAFGAVGLVLAAHFTFAAVRGDYGMHRRAQAEAQLAEASARLAELRAEEARVRLLTQRLSDEYLDLDLLDARARAVLGYVRPDELTLR